MNYRFLQTAVGFARTEMFVDSNGTIQPLSGVELGHALQAVLEDYPPQAAAVSFNLVDSHNTSRISYELGDSYQAKQRLVALLQFTTFGAPLVYYGDETGFFVSDVKGYSDPYNRAPYPWADQGGAPDQAMIDYYAQLARLRHAVPALRTGALKTLFANSTVCAFARAGALDKPALVALNKGGATAVDVPVRGLYPNGATLRDQLSGSDVQVANGKVHVQLSERGGLILVGTS
jgi:cyclomaltodextrinase / maltogenic alpha-amylase / neopullulanase